MSKNHQEKPRLNGFEKSYISNNQDWHIRLED